MTLYKEFCIGKTIGIDKAFFGGAPHSSTLNQISGSYNMITHYTYGEGSHFSPLEFICVYYEN